jgi:putative PIN family toxin of toxin-antitoxin system
MAPRDITVIERVVFDTNIWISGLLWRGKPFQCLLLARSGIVQLVHCSPMIAELAQKLRKPFGFTENRLQAVLYDYKRMSHQVDITGNLHLVSDDPDDDKFVECALVAGASVIVSGDRHLLYLDEYQGVRVLSAAELVAQFTKQD